MAFQHCLRQILIGILIAAAYILSTKVVLDVFQVCYCGNHQLYTER